MPYAMTSTIFKFKCPAAGSGSQQGRGRCMTKATGSDAQPALSVADIGELMALKPLDDDRK